ncbi:MAG: DUF2189 domain-containing protein [Hydrogenophaga sp.]|nr:DUF2189 domain-containing protein [Hydrogenophaga sp.]
MTNRTASFVDPEPMSVTLWSPLRWLAQGWADLRRNPVPGLLHGLAMAAFGWLLLWVARDHFWLLAGAFSGFLLVAPVAATGLYHISRSCAVGRCVGVKEVIALWRSGDGRMVRFGLLLALAGTGWVMTSAALVTLMSTEQIERPMDFLRYVVMAREIGLFEYWLLLGAVLAAPVFASSVVAMPMLVDTSVPVNMAVAASWSAVAENPVPMALWALTISLLIGLGMLTGLLGLIVLVPVLAHASWHAYCDLTRRKTTDHPLPAPPVHA